MLCQPTTTPDGSSASHRNRLFSRAWRGLVASSGSLRRSFSPKASSSSAAAAAVTSAGPSSLSTAAATSLAGPRGDFTLVAAHDLRHLSSSPSPSGTSESVLHGPGSGRTPSGLALATAPEPGHARGDSFGSGLSVSAMPAPVGEAGEQLGRVRPRQTPPVCAQAPCRKYTAAEPCDMHHTVLGHQQDDATRCQLVSCRCMGSLDLADLTPAVCVAMGPVELGTHRSQSLCGEFGSAGRACVSQLLNAWLGG